MPEPTAGNSDWVTALLCFMRGVTLIILVPGTMTLCVLIVANGFFDLDCDPEHAALITVVVLLLFVAVTGSGLDEPPPESPEKTIEP